MSNVLGGIVNGITGGSNSAAQSELANALAQIEAIQTPTANQLDLSQLAQYTNAGTLNPALMNAAQQGASAYNQSNLSAVPVQDVQGAITQLQGIASANGMTPQEQSQIAQALAAANTNEAGQRGAIQQQFANMGDPQSLIAAALANQTEGQQAQNSYLSALQAQSNAAQNALTATSEVGTLGGQLNQQQQNWASQVANAANQINQYNTANVQQQNVQNQATQQAANTYNTQNAQNISNQNVQGQQAVQYQNQVEAPQESASLALQKGGLEAGVGESQANQQTAAGQQSAGLLGSLIGGAATLGAAAIAAWSGGEIGHAEGGYADDTRPKGSMIPATPFAEGGRIEMRQGGRVPGVERVVGDSPINDTVHARLSPGEVVIPKTVAKQPTLLPQFLQAKVPEMAAKLSEPTSVDIGKVFKALSDLRMGQI